MATTTTFLQQVKSLPSTPGVYLFKNKTGNVIYIGKARSLKQRVRSYLRRNQTGYKTNVLVSHIMSVEVIQTSSEIEALLLEAQLVKEKQPKYNVLLRDDKSFPYLQLSVKEPFPRLSLTRRRIDDGSLYFGPYTDAKLLRRAVGVMRKVFPMRTCKVLPKTVCLQFHLGQCGGPCEGKQSRAEYRAVARELKLFLQGKRTQLLRQLTRRMEEKSRAMQFEAAACLRDRLEALSMLQRYQGQGLSLMAAGFPELAELQQTLNLPTLPRRIEAYDISNIQGHEAVGSMVCFLDGRPHKDAYRKFKIKSIQRIDDYHMMREVIRRRCKRLVSHAESAPDLMVIDGGKGHVQCVRDELAACALEHIPVIGLAKHFEEIYLPLRGRPLRLPAASKALHLVQRLRDEAHRFAQAYHHHLRDRALRHSVLDEIPRLSQTVKKRLLHHFTSVAGIKKASLKKLQAIPGIGQRTAENIYRFFH